MNSGKWPCSLWVLVAQWIECPPCVWEVMVSILVGDSDFFFVPHLCHVDQFTFHNKVVPELAQPFLIFNCNSFTLNKITLQNKTENCATCLFAANQSYRTVYNYTEYMTLSTCIWTYGSKAWSILSNRSSGGKTDSPFYYNNRNCHFHPSLAL